MVILYCHIYIHYETYSHKEPSFICLIKSYNEVEEAKGDGEDIRR